MSTLKNRLVIETARNWNALLHLEVGLVRGPVHDPDQLLERTHKQLRNKEWELQFLRKRASEKDQQILQLRNQLSENQKLLARDRQLLLESNRRLSKSQEELQSANIESGSLRARLERTSGIGDEHFDAGLYSDIATLLEKIPADLGGGCSVSKAYVLATLIRDHDLKSTADIGVYRGRSLFPQALAHSRFTGGVAYGIDPWSAEEAREEHMEFGDAEQKRELDRFVENTDWQGIYEKVRSLNDSLGYKAHCVLLRQSSADAVSYFEENGIKLDLVHVDGNHETKKVTEDVEQYTGLLSDGGFVVLDDISFESVRPVYENLLSRMQLVFERKDDDHANDYAVFRNVPPSTEAEYTRQLWLHGL